MSIQDLENIMAWGDAPFCPECGAPMDEETVSVEAFEAQGRLLCVDCHECEREDAADEDEDGE